MSKLDITTQDILRRLGPTSRSRSTKADALFRRLRMEQVDQLTDVLRGAPKAMKPDQLFERKEKTPKTVRTVKGD